MLNKQKMNIAIRAKEHLRTIKNGEVEKSAVAKHCCEKGRTMIEKPTLLRQVTRISDLSIQEKIFMHKNRTLLMNEDLEGLDDILLQCLSPRSGNVGKDQ